MLRPNSPNQTKSPQPSEPKAHEPDHQQQRSHHQNTTISTHFPDTNVLISSNLNPRLKQDVDHHLERSKTWSSSHLEPPIDYHDQVVDRSQFGQSSSGLPPQHQRHQSQDGHGSDHVSSPQSYHPVNDVRNDYQRPTTIPQLTNHNAPNESRAKRKITDTRRRQNRDHQRAHRERQQNTMRQRDEEIEHLRQDIQHLRQLTHSQTQLIDSLQSRQQQQQFEVTNVPVYNNDSGMSDTSHHKMIINPAYVAGIGSVPPHLLTFPHQLRSTYDMGFSFDFNDPSSSPSSPSSSTAPHGLILQQPTPINPSTGWQSTPLIEHGPSDSHLRIGGGEASSNTHSHLRIGGGEASSNNHPPNHPHQSQSEDISRETDGEHLSQPRIDGT